MVHRYGRILLSNKKEQSTNTCNNTDENFKCIILSEKIQIGLYYVIPFIWHSGKAKVVTGNRPGVARGCGLKEEMIIKGHEGQFGGGRSVLYVDFGDGYMAECMYTNI